MSSGSEITVLILTQYAPCTCRDMTQPPARLSVPDLTVSLNRRPEGEWIGLQARTLLHPRGIGWAESVLHDERGELGLATQALVVQQR